MTAPDPTVARRLLPRFDAAPTPYHAVDVVAAELLGAGFREVTADAPLTGPGRHFVRRGGAIVAWASTPDHGPDAPFRVIGAHTDSPNLRVKPRPDTGSGGWRQLGVEVYGGVLANSWLDRDLGLAGRVALRGDGGGVVTRLVRDDRPLLRIPQLAIHLDRDINDKGLLLDRQRHLAPVWSVDPDAPAFDRHLAALLDVDPTDVLGWDVMLHDLTPAALVGVDDAFVASARIDNLLSCFLGLEALLEVAEGPGPAVPVLCLFDHEEVGSVSATGAGAPLLDAVLDRIGAAVDADVEDRARSRAAGLVISADGAHATHPNYPERHEPDHHIALNAGPVLKINANQRYATDAATGAAFVLACEAADVPLQRFVNRTDLACGSTIGPITAGRLGIPVVDVGCPQLAMHSAREMCGSRDPGWFRAALVAALSA